MTYRDAYTLLTSAHNRALAHLANTGDAGDTVHHVLWLDCHAGTRLCRLLLQSPYTTHNPHGNGVLVDPPMTASPYRRLRYLSSFARYLRMHGIVAWPVSVSASDISTSDI